jgi:glycosyl hydrolase family 65
VLGYLELGGDVADPAADETVFLCGPRCAAEVFLGQHRVGRTAFSPVDALEHIDLRIEGETSTTTRVYPDHLEKTHRLADGLVGRSRWFVATDQPCFVVWLTVVHPGRDVRTVEVSARARYNVNYVSKFRLYPDDRFEAEADRLTVRDGRHPSLHVVTATRPTWSGFAVDLERPTSTGVGSPADGESDCGESGVVRATWVNVVDVEAGGAAELVITVAGTDHEGGTDAVVATVLADPAAAFATMISSWEHRARSGVGVESGRQPVDRLFAHAKLWAHKDSRMVPLGPPHALGSTDNAQLLALTASPDYHGIFANDTGQSCWELGALGPELHPVLDQTLDILYRFGVPESVEIDPIDATGTPWLSPLKIGQRPQWVIGAAALVLWSGRYQERYWPRVQEVLAHFAGDDRDGDWLDDYSSSTFPEQPDPGPFRHEMLYASAFWFQAFSLGAELATYLDDAGRAREYGRSARHIADAVERRFGTTYGYASWLDVDHHQHPHQGHTMVLPLQYEMASAERAGATFETLLHGPIWDDNGPLAMEPAYPSLGGAHSWGFMRWNLVDALFRYGRTEEAGLLLERWAIQEDGSHFQSPEGFPTVTGVTGLGYVWTAARSLRALLFGLGGIRLTGGGLVLTPRLPAGWGPVRLERLPFRGSTYDITIAHGAVDALDVDGGPVAWGTPINPTGVPGHHVVSARLGPVRRAAAPRA